jgi:mannose-1-phosphate guanylyltransferase/phosphomannomutase
MKAIILCAGYGTRLGDLTKDTPKPMLPVNGKPLLEYIIDNFRRYGFTDIAINLHYKGDAIRSYFGDGTRHGVSITFFHEQELLGTAGSVRAMQSFIDNDEPFFVHYGDIITDQDFGSMLRFHKSKPDAIATLLVHTRRQSNSIIVTNNDNRITQFIERPSEELRAKCSSDLVNSGIALFSPEMFSYISPTAIDLPRDVYSLITNKAVLYAYHLDSFRVAIDSAERLVIAEEWAKGRLNYDLCDADD